MRDSGCYVRGHETLRLYMRTHQHGLIIFDRHGAGSKKSAPEIEAEVRERCESNGWAGRTDAVVIDPEFESWVWSESPAVVQCLKWRLENGPLRSWLEREELWDSGQPKPKDPKQALERVTNETGVRRLPHLFEKLAGTVSFEMCTDRSFVRLKGILQRWFPLAAGAG